MTKTENLSLPQWEANDPIRREDFNAAMAKLDSMVAIGSYTGNGDTQTIELGFKPRFVIVTGQATANTVSSTALLGYTAFSGGSQVGSVLAFHETGFSVTSVAQTFPALNGNGRVFSYIAFR